MTKTRKKLLIGIGMAVLLLILAVFLCTGRRGQLLHQLIVTHGPDEDWAEIFDFGAEGMVATGLLSMLQVLLMFIPAEPIQVVAGLSYGFGLGVLLCLCGVIVGNSLVYLLYKVYGDRLDRFFTKRIHIDFESARHHGRVAMIVFILYFLPAIPYGMICLFASAMRMKYPRYILITVLSSLPSICIGVGLGYVATEVSWLLSVVVFLLLVALVVILFRHQEAFFDRINRMIERDADVSKTEVRRHNPVLWYLLLFGCRMFFLFRGIKVKTVNRVGKIQGPAIVLCNHGAFVDFYYAARTMRKNRPHFMTARLYFFRRDLGWLLRSLGAFPKSMFSPDFENAKNCRRVLRDGGILAMMPEARLSTAGSFEDIQPDTYRFIHRAGVDVYVCRIRGDYFASPKWGNGLRRGALVETELFRLATAEELKAMTEAEATARVREALDYNDFTWLDTHPNQYYPVPLLAEGLENILTRCPHCGGRYTIETERHLLSCQSCRVTYYLGSRYRFTAKEPHDTPFAFEDFGAWYRWQCEELWREIGEDPDFALTDRVTLHHASIDGRRCLRRAGEGVCTLSREGLTYEGTEDGESIRRHFPMRSVYRVLFGAGEDFEVYDGKEIWYFVPEDKRRCVDYYVAAIKLRELSDRQTEVSV